MYMYDRLGVLFGYLGRYGNDTNLHMILSNASTDQAGSTFGTEIPRRSIAFLNSFDIVFGLTQREQKTSRPPPCTQIQVSRNTYL